MIGHRAARVADAVRRTLARLLHEVRDPRIGFVTLTEVKLSPDLCHAVAYVTVMDARQREETLFALNRATPFLRRSLAREAGLRVTPDLRFVYDSAAESGQRMEDILAQVARERGEERAPTEDDPP